MNLTNRCWPDLQNCRQINIIGPSIIKCVNLLKVTQILTNTLTYLYIFVNILWESDIELLMDPRPKSRSKDGDDYEVDDFNNKDDDCKHNWLQLVIFCRQTSVTSVTSGYFSPTKYCRQPQNYSKLLKDYEDTIEGFLCTFLVQLSQH